MVFYEASFWRRYQYQHPNDPNAYLTAPPKPQPTAEPEKKPQEGGLSGGAIAGIIIAVILIVIILIDLFCCYFNDCGFTHCCYSACCAGKGKGDCKYSFGPKHFIFIIHSDYILHENNVLVDLLAILKSTRIERYFAAIC